ncbi:AraC family transcriptional regulator [Alteromonas aestuariivivens]|uniref:AraC family transcriptional regulator n=1 Tax=Alteromonas aestuariivivens TaxID=1938339 RepID=A0A3D8M6J7_9ALTE|nr:AraC family transcriptional regulator [Alteromonas aestuariivivens]RDV25251.1 AraC family transcriptional regulator [Alteromonas aestuariivivens]
MSDKRLLMLKLLVLWIVEYAKPAKEEQLKQVFRCNFSEYVLRHKLYSAARMLSQTNQSTTQISYELNFSSPSHLIAQFKKQFSTTPRQYRDELSQRNTTAKP